MANHPPSLAEPPLSLRAGNAIDDGAVPLPYDPTLHQPTAKYLDTNSAGIFRLDPVSWRFYLPILIEHSLRNIASPQSAAVGAFLFSFRPPDSDPPRLGSLSETDKAAVVSVLDRLAFDDTSVWKEEAMTALEEYWAPGALYRHGNEA